ncbi:MAG: tetratricopeptide repeat protein [Anaerolineales bacterium]|nr:MAG: tetratricopeptide repeat protein [Anaerolineales bacterium]
MAKVSLRIYNREIEKLIDQGSVDEAIAHCRHILKTFPKHLETYRLLGKAYLETRRYNEAADIFGRLLMAVPDDFVAHVGLGIIRDEENKLDDAIWHMERAFEVQSANPAIQSELQRLYGRRDGVEPPKIRMTRGALSRIYVQGELYPQAIAEIRSVLGEDPQRADMQVLLALSYFKSGQKSDATDMCNQLLKRYPYSFDANRIMVDLLPTTVGATESTQVYRMRVSELDPYATFVKGSIFQAAEVPDASVNLEKLEYSGEEVQMGQDWGSSLGIELGTSPALTASSGTDQPEWLRSGGFDDEAPQPSTGEPASESETEAEIPDFLRAAGWNEASGPEQPTSIFDDETANTGDLVPADLPDWLKGQVPSPASAERPTVRLMDSDDESIETPDWLKGLDESSEQPQETFEASAPSQPESVAADESSDTPDWLKDLGGVEQEQPAETSAEVEIEPAQPADLPDWLKGMEPKSEPEPAASVENLGASAAEQEDAVAWLESLAAKHGAKPEELVTDPSKRSETPPEWVSQAQNIGSGTPSQPSVQDLGASADEQEDAVAWLESLAAKHGAKPEELVTDPSKRSETPPEWVQQAQSINEAKPASDESDAEKFLAEFEQASESTPATDQTGMWLNTLGEKDKQEAIPAGESDEDLPDWLKPSAEEQTLERGEIPEWLNDAQPPAESAPQIEVSEKESVQEQPSDLPDWLSGVDEDAEKSTAGADALMGSQDLSDWLSGLDKEPGLELDPELLRASQRPPFPQQAETPETETDKPEDLPAWIAEPASDEKMEEEIPWDEVESVASTPTEEVDSASQEAPVTLTADLPEWLRDVEDAPAEAVQESEKDLPAWLDDTADDGMEDEKVVEAVQEGEEDLPPWEHREQYEAESAPQEPKRTSPSDWHPVVEKPEPAAQKIERVVEPLPSPEPRETPVVEKKKAPAKPARTRKAEGQSGVGLLNQAKAELERGDIPESLLHYGKLIKKGKHLEEIITHLTDSLYRYPVEVGIWQALGDAYMRANRLKEALDAYNKAEELIR